MIKFKYKARKLINLKSLVLLILTCNSLSCKQKNVDEQHHTVQRTVVKLEDSKEKIFKNNYQILDSSLLFGEWVYNKTWNHVENHWGAVRFVDYDLKYEFRKPNRFKYFKNDKFMHDSIFNQGEFHIDSTKQKIILLFTKNNDSIINIGDTCFYLEHKVHLINDSLLRFEGYSYSTSLVYHDIFEFIKKQ